MSRGLGEDLPDRGPGAPVRPGGGNGAAMFVFAAVLIVGGAVAYIVSQTEDGWYGSPIERAPIERSPLREAGRMVDAGEGGATRVRPSGSPQAWVTDDDYPAEALRKGWQGTVGFTLDVAANGRPVRCTVTASSGTKLLDDRACQLLMRRARFVPARDAAGKPIAGTYTTRFTWRIPG